MPIERLLASPISYRARGQETFAAMQQLDRNLGRPHRAYPSIHIAGTNGKGSVACKIAAALRLQGYKTGLYTSPHLSVFRERIEIDGRMIPPETAEALLAEVFAQADGLTLSFFDYLTALAFLYFARESVDFAVVETGLGGRWDATNVIAPLLSVITSIGYDHTHILGNTLEQIAREKEGIVKPGIPLVAGPKAAPFYPYAIAAPAAAGPFYDLENQAIARTALQVLQRQIPISQDAIEKGVEKRPRCRFEIAGSKILDVAHNPDAFERLTQALAFHFPGRKFPFWMAFSADKDWRRCVEIARPFASSFGFLKGTFPRLAAPEILAAATPDSQVASPQEVKEGVVCGSFYIMSDFLK